LRRLPEFKGWTASEDKLLGAMPDKQLAARLARTVFAIQMRRQKFHIQACHPTWKAWIDAEKALLGKLPDAEVAARTGHPRDSVVATRNRLGISRAPDPSFAPWQPDQDRLLGTFPDAQLARRLGRSESAVRRRRHRLHIAPFGGYKSRPKAGKRRVKIV